MADAYIGYGSTLEVNDGSSSTYVTFARIVSIDLPGHESEDIDSTALDSPDRTREFVAGFKTAGEFNVTQQYTAARYTRLLALDGVSKSWRVTFPDGGQSTFTGYLKKIDRNIELAAITELKFTVKISGDESWDEDGV